MTTTEEVEYVELTFREYKAYGRISNWGHVAEVGPGRHAGVALLMRADGATGVDLIDRYYHPMDRQAEASLYERLSSGHNLQQFRESLCWDSHELAGITWFTGHSAEEYFAGCADGTYDCIVSRATLEHLVDPVGVLRSMIRCTRSGGRLVHKVDLRDHGHFSKGGNHPLTWLTVPSSLWSFMMGYSGRPNRVLVHQHRALLDRLAVEGLLEYDLLVMRLAGGDRIDPHRKLDEVAESERARASRLSASIRPRLAPEFAPVADADLSVVGICLVVRKR